MPLHTVGFGLALLAFVVFSAEGYTLGNVPNQTQTGQTGYNRCGTMDSSTSMCQTAQVNSITDFCLWAPPDPGSTIGASEEFEVAWCTAAGHGARLMPLGTITGAHFLVTPHYIQVTGVGDFTKMNVQAGDEGGELDPHGQTGLGNPIGSVVFANGTQIFEWTSFISDTQFCFRVCPNATDAALWCQHQYDLQGCDWNEPGSYDAGVFESCDGDGTAHPPGVYEVGAGLSTFLQGQAATPAAAPAGASSNCRAVSTVGVLPTTTTSSTTIPTPPRSAGVDTTTSSPASSATGAAAASQTSFGIKHAKAVRNEAGPIALVFSLVVGVVLGGV